MIESLLLTAARVCTFAQGRALTNASGFFFERDERLFLVTSRHVVMDEPSKHFPDRLEIELHTDAGNMAQSTGFSIPLYHDGKSIWRQGLDSAGEIDVAVIELNRSALPHTMAYRAFTPDHLLRPFDQVEVGRSLLVVGFPLGFHDTLHHMPVVRHAVVASSFFLRFQGQGYFLTDARTHRGTSGAPVVMRVTEGNAALGDLPWMLLGVHSARLDVGTRDLELDEALGLNCAWYADMLMTLTER
jgi:S1-C subfamily serine protease